MANIRKKSLTESNNNKQSSIDSTQTNVEKQKESENINKLADVPTPPKELQNTKSNLTVKDLPTSKIIDENDTELFHVYANLGSKKYGVADYRYKIISIPQHYILPQEEYKEKYEYYKTNLINFQKDIETYNDSLDNNTTNEIRNKYYDYQIDKTINRTQYTLLINDLICEFIDTVIQPNIFYTNKADATKHIKSYTAKAKALNWNKLATTTRLKLDKRKYYKNIKGIDKLIESTIKSYWNKANYTPRWKAIFFNYKQPLNKILADYYSKEALKYFYVRWWRDKTNFGTIHISRLQIKKDLNISDHTIRKLYEWIDDEDKQIRKSKGKNTKEKVKNWFFEHGNYRGSNNDCSKQLNITIRNIKEIKNKLKKEGIKLPKKQKKIVSL